MEIVLQNAFGEEQRMTDEGVLYSSLVVTAYQVRQEQWVSWC